MNNGTVIILIFGIVILLMLTILYFINRLVEYRNRIIKQFSIISDYLKENADIIDKLISYIDNNLEHEELFVKQLMDKKCVFENYTLSENDLKKLKQAEKTLLQFTTLENTYSFLAKKEDYLTLKESIINNIGRITYAFDNYDREVMVYNHYRENKLVDKIAKLFRFSEYDYYNK